MTLYCHLHVISVTKTAVLTRYNSILLGSNVWKPLGHCTNWGCRGRSGGLDVHYADEMSALHHQMGRGARVKLPGRIDLARSLARSSSSLVGRAYLISCCIIAAATENGLLTLGSQPTSTPPKDSNLYERKKGPCRKKGQLKEEIPI